MVVHFLSSRSPSSFRDWRWDRKLATKRKGREMLLLYICGGGGEGGGRSRLSRRPVSEFGKQTHFAFPVEGGRKGASSLLRTLAVVIFGPEHRLPPTFFIFYFPTSSFLEKIMYIQYFLYMSLSRSDAGACVPRIFFSYSAFSPRFLLQVT